MPVSVFDLFSIGIGPSSSHTVGPMRAARRFVDLVRHELGDASLAEVARVEVHAYGSLAATGAGHGTFGAILLGLAGFAPESLDPEVGWACLADIEQSKTLDLAGSGHRIELCEAGIVQHPLTILPRHPNGLRFTAYAVSDEREIAHETYYSVGGGFVVTEAEFDVVPTSGDVDLPHPYSSAAELIQICLEQGMRISDVALANEVALRSRDEVTARLGQIWQVMSECIEAGCRTHGYLPGNLKVRRRASTWFEQLNAEIEQGAPLHDLDWAILAAMAVNEQNAAGGRVVTAPTNGAAGIVPAVLFYALKTMPDLGVEGIERYLLTAAAIGSIYKERASISGAEVGCQGEVGSASSMAAGAFAELLGGTPDQCENAAEIAMEHNLGLTCDPVGGLVQVPCIERNGIAATKAITAARMALRGDGTHLVSLDTVIETMRQTGLDMSSKYKETAMGGLAVNVVEC